MSKQHATATAPHSPGRPDADSRCRDEEGGSAESSADGELRGVPDRLTLSEESRMDHAAAMGNETNRNVFGAEAGRAMLDGQAVPPATDQRRFYSIAVPRREDHCPTIRTFGRQGTAESRNDNALEMKASSPEPSPLPVSDEQECQEIEAMNEIPRAEVARTLMPQQQMGVVHENITTKKQLPLVPGHRNAQSTPKATYDPSVSVTRKPEFAATSGHDDTLLNPEENQLDKKNKVPTFLEEVEEQRNSNADEHENLTAQNDVEDPVPVDTERPGASLEDTNPRAINANNMQSPTVRVADDESDVNLRDIKATISEFLSPHVTAFIGRESPIIVELGSHEEDGESMELVDPPTQAYENIDGQNDSNDDSTNLPVSVDVLDMSQSPEENAGFPNDVEDAISGAGHSATSCIELDDQSSEENLEDGGEDAIPGPGAIKHSETSDNENDHQLPEGNTEHDDDGADAVPGPPDEVDDEPPEEDAEGDADVIPGFYEVTLVDILRYLNDRQRTSIPPGIRGIMRRILLFYPQEKENYQITLVDIFRYFNDCQRTSIPPGIREIVRHILLFIPQEKEKDQVLVPICQNDMEKRITNPTDDCNASHFPIPGKEVPNQLNWSKNNNTANHVPLGQVFELRQNVQPQLPAHVFPAQLNVQQHQEENGNPGPEVINRQNSTGVEPGNNRIEINPEMPLELCLRCGAALGYAEHDCPDAIRNEVHAFVMGNRPAENPEDEHAFNDEPFP